MDIGFYIFTLPFLKTIRSALFQVLIAAIAGSLVLYGPTSRESLQALRGDAVLESSGPKLTTGSYSPVGPGHCADRDIHVLDADSEMGSHVFAKGGRIRTGMDRRACADRSI